MVACQVCFRLLRKLLIAALLLTQLHFCIGVLEALTMNADGNSIDTVNLS